MSSPIPEEFADFLSAKTSIVLPISSLSAMYFVYGFYILLFGAYIYTNFSRQRPVGEQPNSRLYLSLTLTLFVLATVYVVAYTIEVVSRSIVFFTVLETRNYRLLVNYLLHDSEKTVVFTLEDMSSVLLNIAADWMLIHRCYVIWSSKKRVGVPLVVASLGTNALGLIAAIIQAVAIADTSTDSAHSLYLLGNTLNAGYLISSAIVNSLITLLTAGRIWWTHRQVRDHGVHSSDRLVQRVSVIILESGILYPIAIIVNLIVVNSTDGVPPPFDMAPIVVLVAGIAPTMIIVRAKLGSNVGSLQDQVSDIRFTSHQAHREGRSQTHVYSIGNLSVATRDIEGEYEDRTGMHREAKEAIAV
uniref:Uncharacterized protein n=1 Tax=Moniliophthora roreri TaxID=221103 RepID=A0A0W0G6F1_MONRR